MKCAIITGGKICDYQFTQKYLGEVDYIICVDGGIRHLKFLNKVKPNVILGDFDSCDKKELESLKNKHINTLTFPTKKDKTDTELALDYAIDLGYKEIIIFGAIGTRMDHTLANIHILKKALEKDVICYLINMDNIVQLVNKEIVMKNNFLTYLSLIPLTTRVKGIVTQGLAYPLKNSELTIGLSLGISNEIVDDTATISVKEGILIVIQSKD